MASDLPEPGIDLGIRRYVDAISDAVGGAVRRVLEAVPDAIVIVDPGGRIALVNAQAETLFGYSRTELIGLPVEQLMPVAARAAHEALRDRYFQHPAVRSMGVGLDLRGRRKDGGEFPVEVSLSPFDTGSEVLTISAIRDITERLEAERARNRLQQQQGRREQAEVALHDREFFLSIAAHELRTPLTGLIGYAQLASRRLDRAERLEGQSLESLRQTLTTITEQANRAGRLVGQLLESARILSGRFDLRPEPVDLGALVSGTVEMVRMAGPDPHRIRLEVRDRIRVDLDRDRIEQVLLNLLDNAQKYSERETTVDILVEREGDEARVTVRDRGIGIPEEARANLFRPFSRVHSDTYRSGLGLGLYISHEIVAAHGGTLSVSSSDGGGTAFVVALPLEAAVAAVAGQPADGRAEGSPSDGPPRERAGQDLAEA